MSMRRGVDMMSFFRILAHEWPDVVARHRRVLEDRLHFDKMVLPFSRDADVTLHHTEQRAVDNCGDDLLLSHSSRRAAWKFSVNESLGVRFDPFPFPRALPHFEYFNMTPKILRVLFRLSQEHTHRLTVHSVDFIRVSMDNRARNTRDIDRLYSYLRTKLSVSVYSILYYET